MNGLAQARDRPEAQLKAGFCPRPWVYLRVPGGKPGPGQSKLYCRRPGAQALAMISRERNSCVGVVRLLQAASLQGKKSGSVLVSLVQLLPPASFP